MRDLMAWLILSTSVAILSQQPIPKSPDPRDVMVAAVSRNDSVLAGGISSGRLHAAGRVDVVPLAWLSPTGEWKEIACNENHQSECPQFERDYLKKPHTYTVVSADGIGAHVQVDEMPLDHECFGFGGQGSYSGGSISYAAIAASSPDVFTVGDSAKRLTNQDAEPVRKAFAATVGDKLDSTKELRIYSLRLEGHDLLAVQRAYQDYGSTPDGQIQLNFIFAIGQISNGRFHLLSWQNRINTDENEQILGIIHLKNGRDFLVNTVSHPEGQYFRVYGIQGGRLTLVLSGGGGSC
jgi:hypothetical protein